MKSFATLVLPFLVYATAFGQIQPTKLDLADPAVRKMILNERKRLDCAGIYQQTKQKLDAQLKLGNKIEASGGINPQIVATMTEVTTALGQTRRNFCELYRVTPELTKEDYFLVFGGLDRGESDVSLLFRYATGKASESALNSLQTVTPRKDGGSIDVVATLTEIRLTVASVMARVGKAEERIASVSKELDAIRRYSEVSKLNFIGTTGWDVSSLRLGTYISRMLEGTFTKANNRIQYSCDPAAIGKFQEVIVKFPDFPFSYYALANCQRKGGENAWKDNARRAIEILQNTTTINGHHRDHDKALRNLKEALSL